MTSAASFETTGRPSISQQIWQAKYRRTAAGGHADANPAASFRRVARALAAAEPVQRQYWQRRFFEVMNSLHFLPAGRVLAGAGARGEATLFNCFVLPSPRGEQASIARTLEQALRTQALGGGVGVDLSLLPPEDDSNVGPAVPGPITFMHDLEEHGLAALDVRERRAAMMATLSCSHPDIGAFIAAKTEAGALRHFNLSVQVSDAFLAAEAADDLWPLRFSETERL